MGKRSRTCEPAGVTGTRTHGHWRQTRPTAPAREPVRAGTPRWRVPIRRWYWPITAAWRSILPGGRTCHIPAPQRPDRPGDRPGQARPYGRMTRSSQPIAGSADRQPRMPAVNRRHGISVPTKADRIPHPLPGRPHAVRVHEGRRRASRPHAVTPRPGLAANSRLRRQTRFEAERLLQRARPGRGRVRGGRP